MTLWVCTLHILICIATKKVITSCSITSVLLLHLAAIRLSTLASILFFTDTPTTEIYTLSLHDALPISCPPNHHSTLKEIRHEITGNCRTFHARFCAENRNRTHDSNATNFYRR